MSQNGLIVYYQRADQKRVDRELKSVDPRLFLDPEFSQQYGQVFWTVKVWNGEQAPDRAHPRDRRADPPLLEGRPGQLRGGDGRERRAAAETGRAPARAV